MRLGSLAIQANGLRVECECGHRRQFDLSAAVTDWGDPEFDQLKSRLRCSACSERSVRIVFTDTADGSPLRLSDLRRNLFNRCGDSNCLTAWWATPNEAHAIAPGGTLDDYKAAIACPQCGRQGLCHHVRLTDEAIPTVTLWMGMSPNERAAKRRR